MLESIRKMTVGKAKYISMAMLLAKRRKGKEEDVAIRRIVRLSNAITDFQKVSSVATTKQ